MLHVIVDTSIYRRDPKREKGGFRALRRLCKGQKAKLYVPEVVKREFVSQQKLAIEEEFQRILTAAKGITRISKSDKLKDFAEKTGQTVNDLTRRVGAKARLEFKEWIDSCNAEVLEIRPKHGNRVMDDYFDGNPPFSSPKSRVDIPDSFIFQNILDVTSNQKTVYVIANDGKLFDAVKAIKNVVAFKDLDEFIGTKECQEALEKLTGEIVTRNIERAKRIIPNKSDALSGMVDLDLVDVLAYKTFRDSQIPEDNNEAMITMVGSAEEVAFDFGQVEYYGGSEIGIPFTAATECLVNYAIFKSEYLTMSEEESQGISVSEWNDHYFDAEQTLTISVQGTLSVEITTAQLEDLDASDDDLEEAIESGDHNVEIQTIWIPGGDSED